MSEVKDDALIDSPSLLYFTQDGDVADIFRSQLPAGWKFEALTSRTDETEKLAKARNANIIIHTDVPLTRDHLEAAGDLMLVHRQGVGLDGLDLDIIRTRGIPVAICTAGTAESVAEHTVMLMLAAGRRLTRIHREITERGEWPKWKYRTQCSGLNGAVVGIVGFGRIGQAVATRLQAFGSEVVVYRRDDQPLPGAWVDAGIRVTRSLEELFGEADILTLHCPLMPETRGLVGKRLLSAMKPGAILINTSRGAIVDEAALTAALAGGQLAAAGLDVLASEPPAPDNPLFALPNVVITAHTASGTRQTQMVKAAAIFDNVRRVLRGEEVVNRVA